MKVPKAIKALLKKAVCPKCGKKLIFGGMQKFFQYVDLETLELEDGKDYTEGKWLQCEHPEHTVKGVFTDAEHQQLTEWLQDQFGA